MRETDRGRFAERPDVEEGRGRRGGGNIPAQKPQDYRPLTSLGNSGTIFLVRRSIEFSGVGRN